MTIKCFACDRVLKNETHRIIETVDGDFFYLGPDCYRKIVAAGEAGWQAPKGGPRLYDYQLGKIISQ